MTANVVPFLALAAALTTAPVLASNPQSVSLQNPVVAGHLEDVLAEGVSFGSSWITAAPAPVPTVRYAHAQCIDENVFYVISGVTTAGAIRPPTSVTTP